MDTTTLATKLNDSNFLKKACPGRFLFTPYWKKTFKSYTSATEKGVCKAITLRELTYDENAYRVMAYSTQSDISQKNINELREIVNSADIGTIRFEAHGTNGFFPLLNENGDLVFAQNNLTGLCKQLDDIYLIIVATQADKKESLDCSQVVYIRNGKQMFHWALADMYIID